MRREGAPQLDDDPERAVRLTAEAHRGDDPGGCGSADPVHALRVGQVDHDPVGVIQAEDVVRRGTGEIESQLCGARTG